MALKPGYKQTEVGVIPEDWEVKQLGDLSAVSSGGTPSRANPQYWDGNIPWITTSEVDFCTITQASQFITRDGLNNSASKLFPAGTLLMALYGQGKTRGKVGILGFDAAINQACAAISLHKDVSSKYIFHFLGSKYEAIRKLSNTGNQENLNGSIVRSIVILYPPSLEQEAIAQALSDADALIESLEQLIAKKRQVKQGAMQELLTGKKRLEGFDGEWLEKRLGDVADFINGRAYQLSEWKTSGTPVIRLQNLTGGENYYYSTLALPQRQYCDFGDLLYMWSATFGPRIWKGSKAIFHYHIWKIEIFPLEVDKLFLYHCLDELTEQLKRSSSSGGTMLHVTKNIMEKTTLLFPSLLEQVAIATTLSDMDAEIVTLETKLEKARRVKQGMMHNLLTGRIRLV